MKKRILSGFAAMGVTAAIIVPLSYGDSSRKGLPPRSANALIALKRLSSDKAQHWAGLGSALHDIAGNRAKSSAASNDLQTGRASRNSPVLLHKMFRG